MIPESNIVAVINNLWVEKFPEGSDAPYPKGLIKRISCVPTREKGRTSEQYTSRIVIQYYDNDSRSFDGIMSVYLGQVRSIESSVHIKNVNYINRTDGYDVKTDKHIMELEFIIKHNII